jgi:hypothetical protein
MTRKTMVVEIHPWKNYKSAIKRMKRLGRPLPAHWDAIKTKHGRQGGPERFVQEIMEALVHGGGPVEVRQSDHKSEEKREQQSEEKREPKSELQSEVESELQNEQASDQASEQASEQHESGEKSELRTERSNGFYRYKYFGNTGWGREVHSYERKLE